MMIVVLSVRLFERYQYCILPAYLLLSRLIDSRMVKSVSKEGEEVRLSPYDLADIRFVSGTRVVGVKEWGR